MWDGRTDRQDGDGMVGLVWGADHFPDRSRELAGWQWGWGWEEASYLTETIDCDQVSAPPVRKTVLSLRQRDSA